MIREIKKSATGFTLLELIIVLAVVSVLTLAVTLILDPLQMIGRANDSRRMSDLASLNDALELAIADGPTKEAGGTDIDGSNSDTCSGELSNTVYVSVPNSEAPPVPSNLPVGWGYGQVAEADLGRVDGNGWIPVDFTNSGNATPPISNLPLDPKNTFASGYYYSYVCGRRPQKFEMTARLVSEKHRIGGTEDKASTDGGDDPFLYEAGTSIGLNPLGPVAHWPFGDASLGAIANNETIGLEDKSGNSHDGIAKNADGSGMQFAQGRSGGDIDFDGVDDYVRVGVGNDYFPLPLFSICSWEKTPGLGAGMSGGGIFSLTYGLTFTINSSGQFYTTMDDGAAAPVVTAPGNLFDDKWHYLCLTFDGTNRYMYVDGTEKISAGTTWLGTTRWPTNGAWMGTNINNGPIFKFNGELDEVTIYDRAISASEVSVIYESMAP